jgi:hypothetical protein
LPLAADLIFCKADFLPKTACSTMAQKPTACLASGSASQPSYAIPTHQLLYLVHPHPIVWCIYICVRLWSYEAALPFARQWQLSLIAYKGRN